MSNDRAAVVSKIARHLSLSGRAFNAFIGPSKNAQSPVRTKLSALDEENGTAGGRYDATEARKEAVDDINVPTKEIAEDTKGSTKLDAGEDILVKPTDPARERSCQSGSLKFGSNSATETDQHARSRKPTVAVKDNIATYYGKTTCASGILKNYVSPYEATVAQRLRKSPFEASGKRAYLQFKYVVSGKTNMDEFGMGSHSTNSHFGSVTNRHPWMDRSAGGSSGGSAVAVAINSRSFALGTDTGGSVRLPAAYNGVVGFKPSYGRISRWGVVPYANSLDTVGVLARYTSCYPKFSDEEYAPLSLQNFFKRVEGHDSRDPTSPPNSFRRRARARIESHVKSSGRWCSDKPKTLRIGVPIEYNIKELHPTVRDTWRGLLKGLRSDGHKIVPVSLPSTKHALSAYYVLAAAEAASNLAKYDGIRYGTRIEGSDGSDDVLYATTRGNGFGDEVKRRILLGSYTLSSEAIDNYFIQAQRVRRLVQRDFNHVFSMPTPLCEEEPFDLSDIDENIELDDKRGPPQVDVLVCPTAPTLPPLLEDVKEQASVNAYMNDVFTVPASLAGLPAISVPVQIPKPLQARNNVPFIGIQVIGQYWDDFHVIDVGGMISSRPQDKRFLREMPERKPLNLTKKSTHGRIDADIATRSSQDMNSEEIMPQDEALIEGQFRKRERKNPEQEKKSRREIPTGLTQIMERSLPKEEPTSARFNGRPIVRKWMNRKL